MVLIERMMNMTERLYYSDPYLSTWETEVIETRPLSNGYALTLKKTAFYPEGGGQPSDYGNIAGIDVKDVYEENGEVYHIVDTLPAQTNVMCEIDWTRRFDHMQQHSGQHLLSALLIDTYDIHTVSFHLGSEAVSIDLNVPQLSLEQLLHIEKIVNDAIYSNRHIKTSEVKKEDLHTLALRKVPELEEIEGIDVSACCGTHVNQIGELGIIKLTKTEKQRGNTRLSFKCGMRALADYQQSQEIVAELSNKFSTNRELVIERIKKLETEQKELQKQLEELKNENAAYLASELEAKKEGSFLFHHFENRTLKDVQALTKQLLQAPDTTLLFSFSGDQKVLLAHSGSEVKCGELYKELLPLYDGKGGGGPKQAQASFSSPENMNAFISAVKAKVTQA
jgi:alanyl-tRNA synthetase